MYVGLLNLFLFNLIHLFSYLKLFGVDNWSQYCLAHLFTYQAFENNVLGLAYVSSPKVYSYGGMCSSLMKRKGVDFSSNTGLSSYKSPSSRQRRLLQKEAELVTGHELGIKKKSFFLHNFITKMMVFI